MRVVPVRTRDVKEWFTCKHYARTVPSVSFCFGLENNGEIIGVVSYGTPPSSALKKGVAGEQYSGIVIELNRLVVNDDAPRNSASFLVGRSVRILPAPRIIVSYADTAQGHIGYVYQACNFIYTGLSAKRTNWHVEGYEGKHSYTIADMSRGKPNRAAFMRETFGEKFTLVPRPRKHRYILIHASKKDTKNINRELRYKPEPYPKGETFRYDASYKPDALSPLARVP